MCISTALLLVFIILMLSFGVLLIVAIIIGIRKHLRERANNQTAADLHESTADKRAPTAKSIKLRKTLLKTSRVLD